MKSCINRTTLAAMIVFMHHPHLQLTSAFTTAFSKKHFYDSSSRRIAFHRQLLFSTAAGSPNPEKVTTTDEPAEKVSLYQEQGLFSVYKPIEWTSNDVVSYIRGILERDARNRGANPSKVGSRKKNSQVIRVGHGGTLDPLATGVLVIGVGSGTKELQSYLSGSKRYKAGGEFGYETTTLDLEGNVTKREAFDHITGDKIKDILPMFTGTIEQVPPIFSAIRKGGKKLYQEARKGVAAEDIDIPSRHVEIYSINMVSCDIPHFVLDVECGGGTYIRSLVRDIGTALGSVATTTKLERTKQGQFLVADAIAKDDWSAENIYAAIAHFNQALSSNEG